MTSSTSATRRDFLIRSGALGGALALGPLSAPMTLAAAPWDARLVVIILRGAMDGLEVVRPEGDPLFAQYRPTLGDRTGSHDLDGYFALNRHLEGLMPLWQKGELAFAHAVATPYRDKRSHFDGQDMLEAGTGTDVGLRAIRDGWLNRMLGHVPGVSVKTAFAVGHEDMKILNGAVPVSSWAPDARLDLTPQGRRLLQALYRGDPVFQAAGQTAIELAALSDQGAPSGQEGSAMAMSAMMRNPARAERAAALAKFAAERLNEETRIAAFSIGGWDTHRTQANAIRRALGELSAAILGLQKTLGSNWKKTVVMAMTEFGRTARENGSRGTDHGTGGVMLMAGGAIRGGRVFGRWPGLRPEQLYQDRDLMPTRDVRAYPAHAMRAMFGLSSSLLEGTIFPGLDMGMDPHILA